MSQKVQNVKKGTCICVHVCLYASIYLCVSVALYVCAAKNKISIFGIYVKWAKSGKFICFLNS